MNERERCIACQDVCHDGQVKCQRDGCRCTLCACYGCERRRYKTAVGDAAYPPKRRKKVSSVLEVTDETLLQRLDRPPVPVLALYHVNGEPLHRFAIQEMGSLAETVRGFLLCVRCDLDENPGVKDAMAIEGMPAFVVYHEKDSREIDRWVGAPAFETMAARLKKLLSLRPPRER